MAYIGKLYTAISTANGATKINEPKRIPVALLCIIKKKPGIHANRIISRRRIRCCIRLRAACDPTSTIVPRKNTKQKAIIAAAMKKMPIPRAKSSITKVSIKLLA
jgi:hypothetical protein